MAVQEQTIRSIGLGINAELTEMENSVGPGALDG
jgi:hypothetical protein